MPEPTYRTYDILTLVTEADPDHYERDVAYEMPNNVKKMDTDNTDSGIYDGL